MAGFDLVTSGTTSWQIGHNWSTPKLVETIVNAESIELVYTQYQTVYLDWQGSQTRCFKIVYSCIDGKWNKSEPIYGEIIPANKETYEFNSEI